MSRLTVFEVEMRAFQEGVIRRVRVPSQELDGNPDHDLERIFYYGQNDFQPVADRCSVSMGDVVRYNGQRWYCSMVGWQQLPEVKVKDTCDHCTSTNARWSVHDPLKLCPSCRKEYRGRQVKP